MIWIIIAVVFVIFVVSVFYHEVKNAPTIDEREPFLWDDYDPKKDPTMQNDSSTKTEWDEELTHFAETFCNNCKYFDGTAMCLTDSNFGELSINLIKHCKDRSLFEAK
jgi:hypothetical protein